MTEHVMAEPAGVAAGVVSDELVEAVVSDAAAGGVDLLGPDGVLAELTKRVLERALSEELTDHLGYEHGDPIGHGTGNSRNETTPKQVLTEVGAVDLDVPRDRNATFEPKIVPKGARRLEGFNANIVALYARGLSTRDIRSELKRMYGVDVSPALVSKVTDSRGAHRVAEPAPRQVLSPAVHRRHGDQGPHRRHCHQPPSLRGGRRRYRRT